MTWRRRALQSEGIPILRWEGPECFSRNYLRPGWLAGPGLRSEKRGDEAAEESRDQTT